MSMTLDGTLNQIGITGFPSSLVINTAGSATLGPMLLAYPSTSNPTSGTAKVLIDTVIYDTDASWNSSAKTFNPKKAGYYLVNGRMWITMTGTGAFTLFGYLNKNGSTVTYTSQLINYGSGFSQTMPVDMIIPMNGTTDYIEMYYGTNSGTANYTANSTQTYLQATYLRGL
jgi:hypothetical protein